MNREIKIGDKLVGPAHPPFIVAELSGNHNQSLERALQIVKAAAQCGADALKIQTYTADTMTLNINGPPFRIEDKNSLWYGNSLHELYEKASTPWQWQEKIFKKCEELGIICFSTPFDATAVDFLEELGNPVYKIASFENADIPLIRKILKTGKPIIMSTGMATLGELEESVEVIKEYGNRNLILLKCTSTYPAEASHTNILTIPNMRTLFDVQVGLSDHTLGTGVAIASVALGASLIEKHFTLSRADGGVDAAFSMEPWEMKLLVEETKRAHQALGQVAYGATEKEKKSMIFKRSLFIVEDLKTGDTLNEKNLKSLRPMVGLPPKYYDILLGRKVTRNIKKGTPVTWDLFNV